MVTEGEPLTDDELRWLRAQVARVVSLDHDGEAFDEVCRADPVLAAVHARAPGFRPALFYSPYEAAVWSIVSARRARSQGIALRTKLAEQFGATFEVAGVRTPAVPTPSRLARSMPCPGCRRTGFPGCTRSPRRRRQDDSMPVGCARCRRRRRRTELQQLPGIGPFYSSLIVIRACGHADVPAPGEGHARAAIQQAYGAELTDAELEVISEGWRPFRTWVTVMMRALASAASRTGAQTTTCPRGIRSGEPASD